MMYFDRYSSRNGLGSFSRRTVRWSDGCLGISQTPCKTSGKIRSVVRKWFRISKDCTSRQVKNVYRYTPDFEELCTYQNKLALTVVRIWRIVDDNYVIKTMFPCKTDEVFAH